ncbi:Glycosyl transferases group 1 [Poriferisphaera corsica]|uniref:Glycosyl transferases group 1 n=1 Tax=Poriferisphaera corsica TaxID=2528020 RepID=A0A517YTC6_9BACT|nr:glycosyltransferase [Poriferisphaera corsica]QDU33485.1 Glycosyl transferases group 1 [Poriferisphaera corsica]
MHQLELNKHLNNQTADVLFLAERPMWPLDQGFRVHGCNMLKSLHQLGISAKVASAEPTTDAPDWLNDLIIDWPNATPHDIQLFHEGWSGPLSKLRHKAASHQGIDIHRLAGAISLIKRCKPKTVIAVGLHGPVLLKGLQQAFPRVKMIWYAADEPITFHLSCLKQEPIKDWPPRFWNILTFAAIERLFARGLDGAIGVSPLDSKRLKRIAAVKSIHTIRNGVDLEYFSPKSNLPDDHSVVFWGRMDFEPNIDAVTWFAKNAWPQLVKRSPNAVFNIVGKNPTPAIQALTQIPGINVLGAVPDIRTHAQNATVAILPMRCGAGIKNKLLESAAMGIPTIASPKAIHGLDISCLEKPFHIAHNPDLWADHVWHLWHDTTYRQQLSQRSRQWVTAKHNWQDAARELIRYINTMFPLDQRLLTSSPDQITQHNKRSNKAA